ncbi:MAG TPA: hypothetical protein VFX59_25675 [Polyangiales bacterium]|nr:hypothetical protein [Polyangiales bacterium]
MARLLFMLVLCVSGVARAEPLRIQRSQEKMKVDGALIEWRGATFHELGSGEDARVRYALASVDGGLYVGAEVYDQALVAGSDAIVLTLAMPKDKGIDTSEVWLYPGRGSERARAAISLNGAAAKPEPQIPIVEGPLARGVGYVVEAFVPWRVIVGSASWHDARGGLRFIDHDGGKQPKILSTDPASRAADLPALSLGLGQEDMLGSFLADHQLVGVQPRFDARDNVSGDARAERVVIIGQYVIVFGPGFKNGESYNYDVLPFAADGGMRSAQLIDLTGDGIKELVASGRQGNLLGLREVWLVLGLDELGMQQKFGIETKKESKGGFLENTVSLLPVRGKELPRIEQKIGRAQGLDASTYREDPATDMQPVLLPWGEVSARTFAFDGKKFAQVDEKRRALPKSTPAAVAALPVAQEPPASASHEALVAAFKQQQGIPTAVQPSQTMRANIALGPEPELIEAYGKVLMLSGPEVGGGNGFMAYATPATDPRDLIEVRAGDVTNDQRADLLLRIRQALGGASGADRELLIVLTADAQGRFVRIGLFEVTRNVGERSIENQYSAKNGTLTIAPGGARVWTKDTYPFTDEASGGAGKLLLPWKDKSIRYRLTNGTLQPE